MLDSKNNLITICITHFNDTDFILNTLYCLEKLTKNNYKVIIRDNNSNVRSYQRLKQEIKKYKDVYLYQVENFNLTGSLAHGTALNDLMTKIDTPYGVILDADCAFLIKDWDEILINELDDRTKVIGTQASGKKPRDFPLMFAILFKTETLKKLNIDFKPKNPLIGQDTGWELREKYLNSGYRGKIIKMKNTRSYKKGPFRRVVCAEFYLTGYSHIFASHFSRGSSLGANKYFKIYKKYFYKLPILNRYFLKKIGKYFLRKRGEKEKQKWIDICKEIVNSQIQRA